MSSGINSYRDLNVWQKSMELARMIHLLVKDLPREELSDRTNQKFTVEIKREGIKCGKWGQSSWY